MAEMIEFYECANYRGPLQAKEERGKYYWRVDCDVDEEEYKVWHEIPEYLYEAMKLYYEETADERGVFKDDGFNLDDDWPDNHEDE